MPWITKDKQMSTRELSVQETQRQRVLAHLMSGKSITPIEALDLYGSFRLSSIIFDLRDQGYDIRTEMITVRKGTRVARYTLAPKKQGV